MNITIQLQSQLKEIYNNNCISYASVFYIQYHLLDIFSHTQPNASGYSKNCTELRFSLFGILIEWMGWRKWIVGRNARFSAGIMCDQIFRLILLAVAFGNVELGCHLMFDTYHRESIVHHKQFVSVLVKHQDIKGTVHRFGKFGHMLYLAKKKKVVFN